MARKKPQSEEPESIPPVPPSPLRLEWLDPSSLDDNPDNWRIHPEAQSKAIEGVIEEVGWAGVLLWNETTRHLIDGHARKRVAVKKGKPVPVLIGSWTPEQERLILASLDPIGALAKPDNGKLNALLEDVRSKSGPLQAMLDQLAKDNPLPTEAKVEELELRPPPAITWVLLAIPASKWGEVQGHIAALEAASEVTVQVSREAVDEA